MSADAPPPSDAPPAPRPIHVLFLCTGNSARSIMAEALLNALGGGRFIAHSAGSHPKGAVHPTTLRVLARHGLPAAGPPTTHLRSKGWEEFARPEAPRMELVITVCDNAAGETCPIWPGHPGTAHWGFEDPAAATGTDAEIEQRFERVFRQIAERLRRFVALPFPESDPAAWQRQVRRLGEP